MSPGQPTTFSPFHNFEDEQDFGYLYLFSGLLCACPSRRVLGSFLAEVPVMQITVFVQSGLPEMVSRTLLRPLAIVLHSRVTPL
jgi:hypothetical protein